MKHQSVRDRMNEGEGMVRHEMRKHMHQDHHHHHKHHSEHYGHGRSQGLYKNEIEHPHIPAEGHMMHGMGMHDFKDEADSIAYGAAGMEGCRSDDKKMHSQFRDYHWD